MLTKFLKFPPFYKISMERCELIILTILIGPALSDNIKKTYFHVIGVKGTELSSLCSILSNVVSVSRQENRSQH